MQGRKLRAAKREAECEAKFKREHETEMEVERLETALGVQFIQVQRRTCIRLIWIFKNLVLVRACFTASLQGVIANI